MIQGTGLNFAEDPFQVEHFQSFGARSRGHRQNACQPVAISFLGGSSAFCLECGILVCS